MDIRRQGPEFRYISLMTSLHEAIGSMSKDRPEYVSFRDFLNVLEKTLDLIQKSAPHQILPRLQGFELDGKKLENATYEPIAHIRAHKGILLSHPINKYDDDIKESKLTRDVNTSLHVGGSIYINDPSFREHDLAAQELFLARHFPIAYYNQPSANLLHRVWCQELFSLSKTAIGGWGLHAVYPLRAQKELAKDEVFFTNANVTAYLTEEPDGTMHLTVVSSDFSIERKGGKEQSPTLHLPGVVSCHFHLTSSGFVLDWYKASNPTILELSSNEYNPKQLSLYTDAIGLTSDFSDAEEIEISNLLNVMSQADVSIQLAWTPLKQCLEDENMPMHLRKAIKEMTTQVLQDPFNQALVINYYDLSLNLESNAQRALKDAMQGLITTCQLVYAPAYVENMLPEILSLTTTLCRTPKEAILPLLFSFQAYALKLNQLPGEWQRLGQQMLEILHTPDFELALLKYRLQQYPSNSSLVSFLTDAAIYPKVVSGIESYEHTHTTQMLFANLGKNYSTKLIDLLLKNLDKFKDNNEMIRHVIDFAISIAIQELFDANGKIEIHMDEILNAHTNVSRKNVEQLPQMQLELIFAFINNLILSQIKPFNPWLAREVDSRLMQLFTENKDFVVNSATILSPSIAALGLFKGEEKKPKKDYQKLFKSKPKETKEEKQPSSPAINRDPSNNKPT